MRKKLGKVILSTMFGSFLMATIPTALAIALIALPAWIGMILIAEDWRRELKDIAGFHLEVAFFPIGLLKCM